MRKILLTITSSVLGIGLMGAVASASAVTCSGSVSNTGAGSTNTVSCVDTNNVSVSCNNKDVITQSNTQNSTSGGATTSGNTSGGNSTSGSSSNSNSTKVQLGASCAPVAGTTTAFTTGAVVTTTSTPAATMTTPAATPTSLPSTGSNSSLDAAIVGVSALGGVSLVSAGAIVLKKQLAK